MTTLLNGSQLEMVIWFILAFSYHENPSLRNFSPDSFILKLSHLYFLNVCSGNHTTRHGFLLITVEVYHPF